MLAVALALAIAGNGQTAPPAFEVASIKPADPSAHGSSTDTSTGRFAMENYPLKECLKWAFDVKDFSLSGPAWLASPRFDIVARPPAGASRRDYPAMMQTLLVERFGLVFHRETRLLSAFALQVDRKGFHAQPAPGSERSGETWGRGLVEGRHETLAEFADLLSRHLNLPVADETAIAGVYDIRLRYLPDEAPADAPAEAGVASSLFAALRDQAGLHLEARKVPIRILVVDRIERHPTEN